MKPEFFDDRIDILDEINSLFVFQMVGIPYVLGLIERSYLGLSEIIQRMGISLIIEISFYHSSSFIINAISGEEF